MAAWFAGPGGIVARAATGGPVADGGPSQRTGSAAGLSHRASAQATQATGARPGGSTAVPPGALPLSHPCAPVQLPKPAAPTDAVTVGAPGQVPALKGFDPVTSHEVASRRTEREQTFANADGTLTIRVYRYPISTRRPDGTWAPIDPSLIDLFGAIAATIIAGRRERLIQGLREIRGALAEECWAFPSPGPRRPGCDMVSNGWQHG